MLSLVIIASLFSATAGQVASDIGTTAGQVATDIGTTAGKVVTDVEDSAVTTQIETLYLLNQHLNPFNINTTTREGNVVITGTVSDEVQKELAEDLALGVKGVRFVDNQLTVINTVIGEKESRSWGQRLEDRSVSAAVKARLLYNGQFKGLKVGISTINNVVTLYGVVPSEEHRDKIGGIAAETAGVDQLVNALTVRPKDSSDPLLGVGRQVSDEWLESRIETAFFLNRHLSTREVDIEVDDGICFLSGSVNSVEKQEVAEQIARSISGVSEVRNNITVRTGEAREMPSPPPSVKSEPEKPSISLQGSEPDEGTLVEPKSPTVEEATLAAP